MLFGCRFDLVFSVGEDCSAAMHLRQAGLRDCSSPFDWICHASFLTPFDLLATGLPKLLLQKLLPRLSNYGGQLQAHLLSGILDQASVSDG